MSDPMAPLLKALRLDPNDPRAFTLTLNVGDEVTVQDALDGAALRRVREAAPKSSIVFWYGLGGLCIGLDNAEDVAGCGATIAEAADKCREALAK